jgi:hypothetical protein
MPARTTHVAQAAVGAQICSRPMETTAAHDLHAQPRQGRSTARLLG